MLKFKTTRPLLLSSSVEQRRRVFEVYLQELLCLQPRPSELNAFMDINQHVWGHDAEGAFVFELFVISVSYTNKQTKI
jgi:hypothetical protein